MDQTADDRQRFEKAIAARVPRPSPSAYKKAARQVAQRWGWTDLTDGFKAVLADEHTKSAKPDIRTIPMPVRVAFAGAIAPGSPPTGAPWPPRRGALSFAASIVTTAAIGRRSDLEAAGLSDSHSQIP
jgi:hypothetical protein